MSPTTIPKFLWSSFIQSGFKHINYSFLCYAKEFHVIVQLRMWNSTCKKGGKNGFQKKLLNQFGQTYSRFHVTTFFKKSKKSLGGFWFLEFFGSQNKKYFWTCGKNSSTPVLTIYKVDCNEVSQLSELVFQSYKQENNKSTSNLYKNRITEYLEVAN